MNINQAKQDVRARLAKHGGTFSRLSAKTVSFEGFGYGSAIFVTTHGLCVPNMPPAAVHETVFGDVPKPSAGGYIVKLWTTQL